MRPPRIQLLVLRSKALTQTVDFYSSLGIQFTEERHGNGPLHYSANLSGLLLEVYPAKDEEHAECATRLGLTIRRSELPNALQDLEFRETAWGRQATLQDPDGRSVDLMLEPESESEVSRGDGESIAGENSVGRSLLEASIETFVTQKGLAERAIAQVPDARLKESLDPRVNSIAVIMKHVAGNLRSRWTDFLTTDGEKSDRDRDQEFIDTYETRAEMLSDWQLGWECLLDALRRLRPDDLNATVQIRGQDHSVPQAIERSLGHTCYHIGQIVQQARIHGGDEWQTLTIPRGESQTYNEQNWGAPRR